VSAGGLLWTPPGGRSIFPVTMNPIKITTALCAAMLALHSSAFAGAEGWTADFAAAKKQAADAKKDLLMDFTGSDWCGWCIKLNDEVFKLDPFKAGVKDTFVLVEIDFPKDKTKLSEETQKQNADLGKKYAVKGYPTILLCDAEGRPYAATGYQKDGPEKYVTHLNELRGRKIQRDEAFATAAKAEGVTKAKALVAALDAMKLDDELVANFYGDVVADISQLDKDDATGYAKAKKAADDKKASAEKNQAAVQQFFGAKIAPLMQAKEFDKALAEVKTYIKENPDTPEEFKVGMLMNIGLAGPMEKKDAAAAMAVVDDVTKTYPTSELAKNADKVKANIKAHLEAKPKEEAPAKAAEK
jgi:thioredoxin-related protein